MKPDPTFRRQFSDRNRVEMHEVFDACIRQATRGALVLKVAQSRGTFEKHTGMHYHFKPEVFVQIEGTTTFRFPHETLVVRPGEACVLPPGLPHHETIEASNGQFRNLVIAYYRNTISVHFAFEARPGEPDIEVIEFFEGTEFEQVEQLAHFLIRCYQSATPARDAALRGLGIAFFAALRNLVDLGEGDLSVETGKVFQAKWIVREQISNTLLSVKMIAARLQCSADYLSHLFHQQTGERLIHYMQRVRMEGAMLALEATSLYVSEIAWASGFADPAYFARVFKKFTGHTPNQYREQFQRLSTAQDPRPKTIYEDREDFSMGEPKSSET